MIYYGGNDYRDYLAHHGVLGMHWGIRRYQPYSVNPRGSGKGGKEIGEAKQLKEAAKQYNRQLSKLTKRRDVDKLHLYDATRKAATAKSQKARDKATAKAEKLRQSLKHTESSIQNAIESAKKDGLNVKEFTKTRDIAAGRKAIATAVGAVGGAIIGGKTAKLGMRIDRGLELATHKVKQIDPATTLYKPRVTELQKKMLYKNPLTNKLLKKAIPESEVVKVPGGGIAVFKLADDVANKRAVNIATASGAISGGITGATLARSGYSAAYRAIHGRGSKIKGTQYKVGLSPEYKKQQKESAKRYKSQQKEYSNRQKEILRKRKKEFKSYTPDDIYEFYEKKKKTQKDE